MYYFGLNFGPEIPSLDHRDQDIRMHLDWETRLHEQPRDVKDSV